PNVICPASGSSTKTLDSAGGVTGLPGGSLRSGTGTSGPARNMSSTSVHDCVTPCAVVREMATDRASTGACENLTTWSGSPVPAGSTSPETCSRWLTGAQLIPTHRNCAGSLVDG